MKRNEGNTDRVFRLVAAISLVGAVHLAPPILGVELALYALAGIFALTAIVGTCPVYYVLGLSTVPRPKILPTTKHENSSQFKKHHDKRP